MTLELGRDEKSIVKRILTRRRLLKDVARISASVPMAGLRVAFAEGVAAAPLQEFGYHEIEVRGDLQAAQRANVLDVLMSLDEDSLLYPFRAMSATASGPSTMRPPANPGQLAGNGTQPASAASRPVPGESLPGWYKWLPNYDYHHDTAGLAPGHCFGQWTSALARFYAASTFNDARGDVRLKERALRLNGLLTESIGPGYFEKSLYPAYSLDKLVCGLMDAHRLLADPAAFPALDRITDAALPTLPGHAIDREIQWKVGAGIDHMWDENYTIPENLYLVAAMGAGQRYRAMARAYLLDETFFVPLAKGINALGDRHAYSYVNSLCSAMQAYLVDGDAMYLESARNGFAMLQAQSFATGGWGPSELLRKSGYDELVLALTTTHNGFETPCGSYAHCKLTRYLLRVTRDGQYGDAMERVLFTTVLGALPLQHDGRAYYHQDLSFTARRVYSTAIWPCCGGSLPQVVADYGINTYLHEPGTLWVNLYQPSGVIWHEGGRTIAVNQDGPYLLEGQVRLSVTVSSPTAFALHLRIPAWANAPQQGAPLLQVNGKAVPLAVTRGFTTVERIWRSGDTVQLQFPMNLRVEALPANGEPAHPELIALLRGPLVLFGLREETESGPMRLTLEALLNARRTGDAEWTVPGADRARTFVPITSVGERTYTTYVLAT